MRRRDFMLPAATAPLLSGCLWPRYFDFGWGEEVRLHDGGLVVVKFKYTYERLGGLTFDRYDPSILRNTEISFDAGAVVGRFTQLFQRHRVDIVERLNAKWYFLLEPSGGPLRVKEGAEWKEEWGSMQNSSGHKCWSLDGNGLRQASINDLPDALLKVNVLMDNMPTAELAALDGTRVTLDQKADFVRRHPFNPSEMHIERPWKSPNKPQ